MMRKRLIFLLYYFKRILSASGYLYIFPVAYVVYLYKRFSGTLPETLWLFSERGDEARDNAFSFFKYVSNKGVENVYFVIDRDSPDIVHFNNATKCIQPNSFRHFYFYLISTHLLGTFLYSGIPGGKLGAFTLPLVRNKLYINLKHGIVQNHRVFESRYIDIISCASNKEIENFFCKTWQSKESLSLLGLCRFDSLIDQSRKTDEKIILIMPTFRKWLHKEKEVRGSTDFIVGTEYYKQWNSLLSSQRLQAALRRNNAKIIFYPHYRVQPFLNHFYSDGHIIEHGDRSVYDIQELLVKSALMVTDYSSVFFDFAYQYKPVIYWQFDKSRFQCEHYSEGKFSFQNDGFGPISSSLEEIESNIIDSLDNELIMSDIYKRRVDHYFVYADQNNCERTFQRIIESKPKKRSISKCS